MRKSVEYVILLMYRENNHLCGHPGGRGAKSCGSGPEYGVTAGNGWGIEDGLKIGFSRFPFEYEMTVRR